jgi:hypothetical protein
MSHLRFLLSMCVITLAFGVASTVKAKNWNKSQPEKSVVTESLDDVGQAGRSQYKNIDVDASPRGALPDIKITKWWEAAEKSDKCMMAGRYMPTNVVPKVRIFSSDVHRQIEWKSPYKRVVSGINMSAISEPPDPIVKLSLDEAYGQEQASVNKAKDWFTFASMQSLGAALGDRYRLQLKDTLLKWATADALKEGIHVSWGQKPVDWQTTTLIGALVTSTAIVADDLSAEERALLGPWMNRLVVDVGSSDWGKRQDNKAYMRAYYLTLWAVTIGDIQLLRQVSDEYKLSIHDMRPDGSLPNDSSRSGMGLKYHADAVKFLTAIAQIFKDTIGTNLHKYQRADGGNLQTLIDFMIKGAKEPAVTNQIYARSCPGGGDRWGGVDTPSIGHTFKSYFLWHYFMDLYPNSKHYSFAASFDRSPQPDEVLIVSGRGIFK